MRLQAAYFFLASVVPVSLAILADEAFHIDYHHALLGTPLAQTTFFHKPSSSSGASLLYTLTEKSILGAVNPKDGSIVWRQNLTEYSSGEPSTHFLRAVDGKDTVIGAVGSGVSAWGASDGKLAWTTQLPEASIFDLELTRSEDAIVQDCVVLSGGKRGVVRRLDGSSGAVKWEYEDKSDDIPFRIHASSSTIYYISLQHISRKGYRVRVVELKPENGRLVEGYTLHSESEATSPESITLVNKNAAPLIAWLDQDTKTLKINTLDSQQTHSIDIENDTGEVVQNFKILASDVVPHFVVHCSTASKSWMIVFHINSKPERIARAYRLALGEPGSASASTDLTGQLFFTRITKSTVELFSSASGEVLGTWPVKEKLSEPTQTVLDVVSRGTGFAIRFAQVDESGDWLLVRNGELEWRRPESLADAAIAAFAGTTSGEALAHELEVEGHQDVLSAYIHRVKRHLKALREDFLPWIQDLPNDIVSSFLSNDGTELSQFGFGKPVIVATYKGRILALDSGRQGAVLWNVKAVDSTKAWKAKAISVQHDTATVFVADGSAVKVNVTSGNIIATSPPTEQDLAFAFISDLPTTIKPDGIPLGSQLKPDGSQVLVTQSEDGKILGWSGANMQSPAWEFAPPNNQKIIHATSRPSHDPVASIGKVLGDRSVLYKYLNPNIALITTTAGSTALFYVLDGVSGQILHTASQNGVDTSQPIASVISENWFAYSYWADVTDTSDAKGYRLVISELYESPHPNDRGGLGAATNYSSIHSNTGLPKPHVISQTYMIPEAISNMAVTETRQGITIKQLLCTLPASNAIVGIPRFVLDPRRPVNRDPNSQEVEEGLTRYLPFLEFDPKWYLNHAREVLGIKHIDSSPTLLESSTLVFAYGFDVFGTRLAPSQPFDILGKGFSKIQLLLTVVALAVGVGMLRPMVRKKQVDLFWKSSQ